MKKLIASIWAISCVSVLMNAQLVCTNAAASDTTVYTNGMPNDTVYFICQGESASLLATPPGGIGNWDFEWYSFSVANNAWVLTNTQVNQPQGTKTVNTGGFRVKIYDSADNFIASYITWICRVNIAPIVNANTILPGCTTVNLSGLFIDGTASPYYNPPQENLSNALIVGPETDISVCFGATHPFAADLGFYLQGPASCGSPVVTLLPSPFSIESDSVCSPVADADNLCFSTEAFSNLDYCNEAFTTLTGIYDSYGPDAEPIDWTPLYGCNANTPGWTLEIRDCAGGVEGSFTYASLNFSGIDEDNVILNLEYSSPVTFSQPIPDGDCANGAEFVTQIQPIPASIIQNNFAFHWTSDPPFTIPNNGSSLNSLLDPAPQVDTYFILEVTGPDIGSACGAATIDVELYDYIPPQNAEITTPDDSLCLADDPILLASNQSEGYWEGAGIDSESGLFDPAVAGLGTWSLSYVPAQSCISTGTIDIVVSTPASFSIDPHPAVCSTDDPFAFTADYPGGLWSGEGIIDPVSGTFDPSLVSGNQATVTYTVYGACPSSDDQNITVQQFTALELTSPQTVICESANDLDLSVNVSGGQWSGTGITNTTTGIFDPSIAGPGEWTIEYSYSGVCEVNEEITLVVDDASISVTEVAAICENALAFDLSAGPAGGYWSGDGIVDVNAGSFDPQTLDPGDYTVYYHIDNACNLIDSIVVQVENIPVISLDIPVGLCVNDDPVILTADLAGGSWSGSGITNGNLGIFDPAVANGSLASLTYTYNGVCDASASGDIAIYPLPIIDAGENVAICPGDSVILHATGGQNYQWTPASSLSSSTLANPAAFPLNTQTYQVTGESAQGCSGVDVVTVEVYDAPQVIVNGPLSICADETVQLQASGLSSYLWTGENLSENDLPDPLAAPAETTTYLVEGEDDNGCSGSAEVEVIVNDPLADFSPISFSGVSPFQAEFVNNSTGANFYWDFGNGNTQTTVSPAVNTSSTYLGANTYTVTLTAELNGCTSTMSLQVTSYYDSEILGIPNIVTMGGDGKNDGFRILGQNIRDLQIDIYDRWGKKVGEISQPGAQWDPSDQGEGSYYYILHATGYDELTYERSGSFTVVSESK